jgi:hypothetical protein
VNSITNKNKQADNVNYTTGKNPFASYNEIINKMLRLQSGTQEKV